jgi:hypothetical protein
VFCSCRPAHRAHMPEPFPCGTLIRPAPTRVLQLRRCQACPPEGWDAQIRPVNDPCLRLTLTLRKGGGPNPQLGQMNGRAHSGAAGGGAGNQAAARRSLFSYLHLRAVAITAAASCVVLLVGHALRASTERRTSVMLAWTPALPVGCETVCLRCVRRSLSGHDMQMDGQCRICSCGESIPGTEPIGPVGDYRGATSWADDNTWWWDAMSVPPEPRFGTVEGAECGDVCPKVCASRPCLKRLCDQTLGQSLTPGSLHCSVTWGS